MVLSGRGGAFDEVNVILGIAFWRTPGLLSAALENGTVSAVKSEHSTIGE